MNVLSLFDGISSGLIALRGLNVTVDSYYASEIDETAIAVSKHNFPDIVRLGDVKGWANWDIDFSSIDLILAGSPCQGFTLAGKMLGLDDPRSALFFVFLDILNHTKKVNPNVRYLLENVVMSKVNISTLSHYLNARPVRINASLVSAGIRDRLYWSNGREIKQPEDRNILLRDILDTRCKESKKISEYSRAKRVKILNNPLRYRVTGICSNSISELSTIGTEKSSTITTHHVPKIMLHYDGSNPLNSTIRELTADEMAKTMGIPSWYVLPGDKKKVTTLLGNGWNIEVIQHLLTFIL